MVKVDSALLRRFAYWGARHGPRAFVEHSPRAIGMLFALALPGVRRRVLENLRRVFGQRSGLAEQYDVLRTFMNYAACLAEGLGTERMEARRVKFHAEGAEHLESALSADRGLILLTAHIGPFEAAARYFSQVHHVNLMVVMNKEPNPAARQFHDDLRRKMGVVVTHVGEHPLDALPVLGHLERGGVAAIQLDRLSGNGRNLDAKFFGGTWPIPEGPLRLASLCEVPLMTVFTRRRAYFDYELVMSELMHVGRRPSRPELEAHAQKLAAGLERAILRDPTQWFHFARGEAAGEPRQSLSQSRSSLGTRGLSSTSQAADERRVAGTRRPF